MQASGESSKIPPGTAFLKQCVIRVNGMKQKLLTAFLILAVIAGIGGAAVSVAMVIRAVQWSEWGRVVLYSVTMAVCVEMTVLAIGKLRNHENA